MGNVFAFTKDISVGKLMWSYICVAFVYIGQLSICIPIAIKMKKTVVVTAFGFFWGMLTVFIATLVSEIEVLDSIYKLTPYSYNIAEIGVLAPMRDLFAVLLVSVGYTLFMGFLSWLIFRKADIK